MAKLLLLNPARTGIQAQDLETRLRRIVAEHDDAITKVNRPHKVVVFRPLGTAEMRRIVDIEIEKVQERVHASASRSSFAMNVTRSAREFLLSKGTDAGCGARHLKRAIERLLVQPLANLMASGRIKRGSSVRVSHHEDSRSLLFFLEAAATEHWTAAAHMAA